MRMDSWAIHGSNQAMNQWAQAWQRQWQQRNLNFDSECSRDWINWQSKKKRKSFVSVHSEGSVGMGSVGSFAWYGVWVHICSTVSGLVRHFSHMRTYTHGSNTS